MTNTSEYRAHVYTAMDNRLTMIDLLFSGEQEPNVHMQIPNAKLGRETEDAARSIARELLLHGIEPDQVEVLNAKRFSYVDRRKGKSDPHYRIEDCTGQGIPSANYGALQMRIGDFMRDQRFIEQVKESQELEGAAA
jgi:hypothetical protein